MIQPNTVITGDSLTILRNMEPESVLEPAPVAQQRGRCRRVVHRTALR